MSGPVQYVTYNGVSMSTQDYIKLREAQKTKPLEIVEEVAPVVEQEVKEEDKVIVPEEVSTDEVIMERKDAVKLYKEKFGKLPSPQRDAKTILSKIQ